MNHVYKFMYDGFEYEFEMSEDHFHLCAVRDDGEEVNEDHAFNLYKEHEDDICEILADILSMYEPRTLH